MYASNVKCYLIFVFAQLHERLHCGRWLHGSRTARVAQLTLAAPLHLCATRMSTERSHACGKTCSLCGLFSRHAPTFTRSRASSHQYHVHTQRAPAFTCANVHSYSCKRCATIHSDVHSPAHYASADVDVSTNLPFFTPLVPRMVLAMS